MSRSGAPDEHALLDAVGKVYAAVLDSAEWEGAISTVGRLVGANSGLLQVTGIPGAQVGYVGFGIDPERGRTYVEHFAAVDLYLPAARAKVKPGDVIWEYEVIPPDELPGTEIFEDYLRPQGLFGMGQSLGGILENDSRGLAFVQFVNRTRKRCLATSAQETLELLLPHIRRAALIQARIGEARLAEATLERLPMGVVLLDSSGRVLRLNKAATETLSARDGLEMRRDGLHAADRKIHAALQRMIAHTAVPAPGNGAPGGTLAIQRPSGRRPLSLVAVPIPPAATLFSPLLGTAIILFISDPQAEPPAAPAEALSALYGLTPAEARTALLVAEGRAPKDVAEKLGVSIHTVRTVLKRVFAKMGVERQAALARLVTLALPFVRPDI
jgi:DNA-binding CsgD family transcriptional regulator/PAS domain-containing protein